MFLHHFVCSVHFPNVQKHNGIETIPHFYWKNDKGVKPANGIQPVFCGDFVDGSSFLPRPLVQGTLLSGRFKTRTSRWWFELTSLWVHPPLVVLQNKYIHLAMVREFAGWGYSTVRYQLA